MTEQKTLKGAVRLRGVGLHTGGVVELELRPAEPDSGVVFVRTDLLGSNGGSARVEARVERLGSRPRRTALVQGPAEVHTTEHLLAALCAAGVHNVEVRLNAPELPGLDGSALPFYEAIRSVGTDTQGVPPPEVRVSEPVLAQEPGEHGAWIAAIPCPEGFRISYTLDYSRLASAMGVSPAVRALATQYFDVLVTEETFAREIAPARTFVFEHEVRQLRAEGLGKGANTQNTLVLGKDGILENSLRFPDEFVRHKILDMIGDLYLLGAQPLGRFVAAKSGHALNVLVAKQISSPDALAVGRAVRESLSWNAR